MMQFLTILLVVLLVGGVLYTLWRPHWAIIPVILMFPIEQLAQVYIPQLWAFGPLVNFTVAGIVFFAIASRMARGESVVRGAWNPVSICLLLLYGMVYLSLVYTPSPEPMHYVRRGLPYVLFMLVAPPLILPSVRELPRLLTVIMILGTVLTLLILANPRASFLSGRLTLQVGDMATDRGNPLAIAEMGGVIAIIAALIRYQRATTLFNIVRLGAFLVGLGIAVQSGSRGQVYATIAACVMFYPVARQIANPKQFLLVATGLMLMAGMMYLALRFFVTDQNVSRWTFETANKGLVDRFDRVSILFVYFFEHPSTWLFGIGVNGFSAAYGGISYVHNVPAEVLCEQGVVGFSLYVAAIWYCYRYGYRLWNWYRDDPYMRSAVAVLLAVTVFQGILTLKQGSIVNLPTFFMYMLIIAKLARSAELQHAEEHAAAAWTGRDEIWDAAYAGDYLDDDIAHDDDEGEPQLALS